jgi:ligand-binding sensor domain-containing protein
MKSIRFNRLGSRRADAGILALLVVTSGWLVAQPVAEAPFPVIERFENFGIADGIPSYKVHSVLKTSDDQLWIGTWDGLCRREPDGSWRRFGPEHGLSHRMVTSLVEDPATGDLWVGTMRGLNRFSAGRITTFSQLDSGLANDVVYSVDVLDDTVWVATAAGTSSFDQRRGEWRIYDHNNSIMHEPWCYSIKGAVDRVFIGVWGGGIVEHHPGAGWFKEHRDPDRDFHFNLIPDAGPINDITSWLSWEDGILWQCTYFGFARYDGRSWRTWVAEKSPLLSDFTQFVWPHRRVAWIGMDAGVSVTDGNTWVNYRVGDSGEGILEIHRPGQPMELRPMTTALAHQFVLGIYVDDQEAWFATSKGLSRGVFAPSQPLTRLTRSVGTTLNAQ